MRTDNKMVKKNLSEFLLIDRINRRFSSYKNDVIKGIGDDCAIIKSHRDKYLLYTCDSLVSGIHFSEKYSTPYQIGQKTVAVNISDIAAKGGKPDYFLVSLFLPENITEKFIDELYQGLAEQCHLYDIDIIGGNIAKSNQFIIDIFLIGEVSPDNLLLRSEAKVGDVVMVTGTLGDSAAGLKLLQNHKLNTLEKDKKKFISRHITPIPRIKEGMIIAESRKATAMIDISDGLSSDLLHICEASHVGVRLYANNIPVSDGIVIDLALDGGEDYELCFTVPQKYASHIIQRIKRETSTMVTIVGEIIPQKEGRWLINNKGKKHPLKSKGWDHLR